MIVVTGGAGFIGLNYVYRHLNLSDEKIINIDSLTYSANKNSLPKNSLHEFVYADINDREKIKDVFLQKPRVVVNFAAESHVDNSIKNPDKFISSNILGTYNLLELVREYSPDTLFIHVSTDEVYGSLEANDRKFTETTQYLPNSPYSASKAASDHLVRAWHKTYNLKTIITHCSNNYGEYQYPEKLIPLTIKNAIEGNAITVYGTGENIREWIYVQDHCDAINFLIENGEIGEVYNIGTGNELSNIDLVNLICNILDRISPKTQGYYRDQIKFVDDRPGHDFRYSIDNTKIKKLGWESTTDFIETLEKTIRSYL